MAIYRLEIKPVTRSSGRSATSAAAYRAGERIRDERTGALYNHSQRRDVLHKEILLPSSVEQVSSRMDWARDRATLWNAAEKAERRSDSRVAREYLVSLPPELSPEERVTLARTFSREIADRYSVAVDLAVHAPRPEGDPRNFHAHLLATTREVTPDGLGPKTG
ncbi:MAG TPA: MobA/MobL family protein, partial [Steroidobacteraceae bacterium]|nr:MobA/MobL family protein [Steroidobacteraceae bacterium]